MAKRGSRPTPSIAPLRTDLAAEATADALVIEAEKQLEKGQQSLAIKTLTQALNVDPVHAGALYLQARLLEKHEQRETAIKMMQAVVLQSPEDTRAYFYLAQWLAKAGDSRSAIAAMRRVVQLEPQHAAARRHLAAMYGTLGFDEHAKYWAEKSVGGQAITTVPAKVSPKLTILSLHTAVAGDLKINRQTFSTRMTQGHVNLLSGVDSDHVSVVHFYVDALDKKPEILRRLPKADLIVNSMTDAERCEEPLEKARKACDRLGLPVINSPSAVANTDRLDTYAQFKDAPGMLAPKIVLLENVQENIADTIREGAKAHGLAAPVIVRAPGFNGPQFTQAIDDLDALTEDDVAPGDLYLIQHHDVWFTDERIPDAKIYPKYRAVLVGDQLYPAHLRFALDDYNVHRAASDKVMAAHPWLKELNQSFLDDPESHFPPGQWEQLRQALLTQGLDYTGADFAPATHPNDEGKLIIFEANAAMRSWLTDLPEGDPVQLAWQRIVTAAHEHFCAKAGVEPWDFQLPKGRDLEAEKAELEKQKALAKAKAEATAKRRKKSLH